jgi:hypothetical protein
MRSFWNETSVSDMHIDRVVAACFRSAFHLDNGAVVEHGCFKGSTATTHAACCED